MSTKPPTSKREAENKKTALTFYLVKINNACDKKRRDIFIPREDHYIFLMKNRSYRHPETEL